MVNLISILVVDDHAVFREGVIKIVSGLPNLKYYDEAENGQLALEKLEETHFDIVILDIEMKVMNGIETAYEIKKKHKNVKIIMLSMYADRRQIVELINLGIDAYVTKSSDKNEILSALNLLALGGKYFTEEVLSIWNKHNVLPEENLKTGEPRLSSREKEIVKLLCDGLTAKEIANKISLSESTINTHRHNIMKKIGVKNIVGLIKYINKLQILN